MIYNYYAVCRYNVILYYLRKKIENILTLIFGLIFRNGDMPQLGYGAVQNGCIISNMGFCASTRPCMNMLTLIMK